MKKKTILILYLFAAIYSHAQDTLLLGISLPEITLYEEKNENERSLVPQKIESIQALAIIQAHPTTSADLLQKSGAIMIQMSQSGGGSPIIRGFEANRVLMLVDGVRMNNAIFRSGHLQNSISTSPQMMERIDIIFGPSSVKYGSDALGGAIHFHTKSPKIGEAAKGSFYQKYNSVNKGVNTHFDYIWSKGKWAFLSGLTLNKFGNLTMGGQRFHNDEKWGAEEHITDGNEQLKTGYNQIDAMQKIRYQHSQSANYMLNIQTSSTTKINRFDKLNDLINGSPKYKDWYYGPQKRGLISLSSQWKKETTLFEEINNTLAFQLFEESRYSQKINASMKERVEKVIVASNTLDFIKKFNENTLNYGLDYQFNQVTSKANQGTPTRYADGGSWLTLFSFYTQYKKYVSKSSFISGGLRYSINSLDATFVSTDFYPFNFNNVELKNNAFTSSLGLNVESNNHFDISATLSSGFRSPNVDDVTKVFSKSGTVTVPNVELLPEYSYNAEISIRKSFNDSYISASGFYTYLKDAIVKRSFLLNGQDSLWYDDEYLPVVANTNAQKAHIYGFNAKMYVKIGSQWSTTHTLNYTFGRELDSGLFLDHIPPLYGKSEVVWKEKKHRGTLQLMYNGWKHAEEYSTSGSDNFEETTELGNPPWWILNIYYNADINDKLSASVGVENTLDAHYKTYSSGISAPGRNFIISLNAKF